MAISSSEPRWSFRSGLVACLTFVMAIGAIQVSDQTAHAADCASGTTDNTFSGGDGQSAETAWQISTAQDLIRVSELTASSGGISSFRNDFFVQTEHIDLEGCNWTPIGSGTQVTLKYDGQGHTISGLTIATGGFQGGFIDWLQRDDFGSVGSVSNLGIVDASVETSRRTGVFVGRLRGANIANSFATGSVTHTGTAQAGGLVGQLDDYVGANAQISDSYSLATVSSGAGKKDTGGLVGQTTGANDNAVIRSFSTGVISTGDPDTGDGRGLVGNSSFTIVDTASFWDTDTSGVSVSYAGTGKTTEEMKAFATFDDAGWDIVDGWEAYNFDNPTNKWGICAGVNNGYPFLLWQFSEDPCSVESSSSNQQSSSTGDSDSGVPGIYLTVQGRSGDTASGSLIGFGGFAVAPNAPYLLTLRPVQEAAAQTVLARGVMNSGGHLEDEVTLGALASGSHEVVFASRDRMGALLTLANVVVVDRDGRFQSITPEELQPRVR